MARPRRIGLTVDIDAKDEIAFMGIISRTVGDIMGRKHAGPVVLQAMEELQQEWWDTAGGGTWPPLAPSTLAQKRQLGYPDDILVRTGRLMESATENPSRRSKDARAEFYADEVYWVIRVPYGWPHQVGAGNLPERNLFDDTPQAHKYIADAVDEWLEEHLKAKSSKELASKLKRSPYQKAKRKR